jgi:formyl-CoA transferase
MGNPMKLSSTPVEIRSAPPALGQHTDTILQDDVGLSADEIAALRVAGVIA